MNVLNPGFWTCVPARFEGRRVKTTDKPVPAPLAKLFKAVPKTDLHMHLPGSTPIRFIRSILRKAGWSEAQINRETKLKKQFQSLNDFLKTYYRVTRHIKTPAQFKKAAFKITQDCAKENVRYFEIRASILHKGAPPETIVKAIEEGLQEGMAWTKKHLGKSIQSGIIILAQRAGSPEDSYQSAELAVKLSRQKGSMICGFDLAGSETDHSPLRHAKALRYADKNGLPVTVHAGETENSGEISGVESVKQALRLGADRIGHGLQVAKDARLMNRFKKHQTPVELAPWTNVQLKSVNSFANHPLPQFLENGLNVSLCTDNRMVSNINLTEQMKRLYQHGILTRWDQIRTLVLNGIRGAFLPDTEKKRLFNSVTRELNGLEKDPFYRRLINLYLSGSGQTQNPKLPAQA